MVHTDLSSSIGRHNVCYVASHFCHVLLVTARLMASWPHLLMGRVEKPFVTIFAIYPKESGRTSGQRVAQLGES